ncbi:hypothetical protein RB595_008278 [Gaeumannomyces hyphopodioides]
MASSSKAAAVRKPTFDLTHRECELVAAAWLSAQDPQIDWDKFATIAGFKNAHSARTCFGPLKKKLQEKYGNGKPTDGVVKSYKWTPRQRKRKATADGDAAEAASGSATPGENLAASAASAASPAAKSSRNRADNSRKRSRELLIDHDATEDEEDESDAAPTAAAKRDKRNKAIPEADVLHDPLDAYDMDGVV